MEKEEKKNLTRQEQLEIGRLVQTGELSVKEAAAKYMTSIPNIGSCRTLYKALLSLSEKGDFTIGEIKRHVRSSLEVRITSGRWIVVNGLTAEEAALVLSCSVMTARRYIRVYRRQQGETFNKSNIRPGTEREERMRIGREIYDSLYSVKTAAQHYKIGISTARSYFREYQGFLLKENEKGSDTENNKKQEKKQNGRYDT